MSILDNQLAEGRLLLHLPQFKRKEEKALEDLRTMLSLCPKTYLSLSWGKQSIILAHMLWQLKSKIPIVFFDEPDTDIIANFIEVRNEFLKRWGIINYHHVSDGKCSPRESGKEYMKTHGLNGNIMGLAAHESKARRHTLMKNDKHNIFMYVNGDYRSCPLRNWTVKDYAAYIAKYGIPLLSTYHKYGLEARTAAGITPGKHSYMGRELLNSLDQGELDKRWRERRKDNAF